VSLVKGLTGPIKDPRWGLDLLQNRPGSGDRRSARGWMTLPKVLRMGKRANYSRNNLSQDAEEQARKEEGDDGKQV
jgi:hypothetical protein